MPEPGGPRAWTRSSWRPHDGDRRGRLVEYASQAGVPVLSYDRLVMNAAQEFHYVAFDAVHIGELQGEFLARAVPRGRYLLLHGPTTDNNAELFREGAMRHLRPLIERGDVTVLKEARVRDYLRLGGERICRRGAGRRDAGSTRCWQRPTVSPPGRSGRWPRTGWPARCPSPASTPSWPRPSASSRARSP